MEWNFFKSLIFVFSKIFIMGYYMVNSGIGEWGVCYSWCYCKVVLEENIIFGFSIWRVILFLFYGVDYIWFNWLFFFKDWLFDLFLVIFFFNNFLICIFV